MSDVIVVIEPQTVGIALLLPMKDAVEAANVSRSGVRWLRARQCRQATKKAGHRGGFVVVGVKDSQFVRWKTVVQQTLHSLHIHVWMEKSNSRDSCPERRVGAKKLGGHVAAARVRDNEKAIVGLGA